jgi:hypothetical protein
MPTGGLPLVQKSHTAVVALCLLALLACKKLGAKEEAAPSASAAAPVAPAPSAAAGSTPSVLVVPKSDTKLESDKSYWVEGRGGAHRKPKSLTVSKVTFRHTGGCTVKKLSSIGGAEVACLERVPLCVYTQRALLADDGWSIVKDQGKGPMSYQVVAEKGSKQIAVDVEPMLPGKPDMACKMMIFAGEKK